MLDIDNFIKEDLSLDSFDQEILKSARNFDNGQTSYSSRNFVVNTGLTPYKKLQQCMMELETRYNNYRGTYFKIRKAKVQSKILLRDIENSNDELKKELLTIEHEDVTQDIEFMSCKLEQGKREIQDYLNHVKELANNLDILKKSIEHNQEEETTYWKARMAKQAAMDIISYGRIGSGQMESILLMNENDQLETLQGAIKFAGLLNSTIGNINKQIESDVQKHLDLSNVQMPKLEIEKQLLKLDENFQPSVKSKISGESI
tara:strand:- start:90 stop:869 length:780 start_codon:yes stop_codon:yes gene_type:complete